MSNINLLHNPLALQAFFADSGLFSNLDIHFANFMARLSATDSPAVPLAAALVSSKTNEGNICLDLGEYAGSNLFAKSNEETPIQYACPALAAWTDHLLQSGVVGEGHGNTPLVLDRKGRLYLRRYWEYEETILNFILKRADTVLQDIDYPRLERDIQKLFKPQESGKTDWQKISTISAVTRSFSVISGGPGTGKTTTVARLLALLLDQYKNKLRVVLAAPTGKAASRLQEAISTTGLLQEKTDLPKAATLHRMLGPIPNSPYFRHDADNKIAADAIIVDEASMVDLPLMAKLMQAVPDSARLILLGDRNQLASVQPGSVFGDICHPEAMRCFSDSFIHKTLESSDRKQTVTNRPLKAGVSGLQNSFVELVDNYRFPGKRGIAALSNAVKDGDGGGALDLLLTEKTELISWSDI
ncbi:MAG: AAA family ATPase, partial [Deltaproteobacteria bacterium]|nr:AAA family ATPase [Deltaproteobacteria bacterium]